VYVQISCTYGKLKFAKLVFSESSECLKLLVYWERFRPTLSLWNSDICSVWEHLRDALYQLFTEPYCFRGCTSITKALFSQMFTRT